jgi:hypothetical protein
MGFCFICRYDFDAPKLHKRLTKSTIVDRQEIAFASISATRARGIVAGGAKDCLDFPLLAHSPNAPK